MSRYDPQIDRVLRSDANLTWKHDVYLAGPFFSDDQVATLERVETLLSNHDLSCYSPRLAQRYERGMPRLVAQRCMWLNKYHCTHSKLVLACLSFPDTGTSWELGWAAAQDTPILGFYGSDRIALNLMIRECCDAMVPERVLPGVLSGLPNIIHQYHLMNDYLRELEERMAPPEINE